MAAFSFVEIKRFFPHHRLTSELKPDLSTEFAWRIKNTKLKSCRLREEDIVFQVDMLVEIILELLKLLVSDRKGIADIFR